jgi:uncharacterized protein YegL
MSSMLEKMVEVANPQQPHIPVVLLLDTSGSMSAGSKISDLNEGLSIFKSDIETDDLASKRVDLAIIAFSDTATVIHDFSSVNDFEPPNLSPEGLTSMGEAILKSIEMVEGRKNQYKELGVDYYRPWIFMITDGEPTDMQPGDERWNNVVQAVHQGETSGKFMFFGVAVEPANIEILKLITPPNRPPVRLKQGRFKELFQWFSRSQKKVSSSRPGEQVTMETPVAAGWGEFTV